jgi:hypothetical protein
MSGLFSPNFKVRNEPLYFRPRIRTIMRYFSACLMTARIFAGMKVIWCHFLDLNSVDCLWSKLRRVSSCLTRFSHTFLHGLGLFSGIVNKCYTCSIAWLGQRPRWPCDLRILRRQVICSLQSKKMPYSRDFSGHLVVISGQENAVLCSLAPLTSANLRFSEISALHYKSLNIERKTA